LGEGAEQQFEKSEHAIGIEFPNLSSGLVSANVQSSRPACGPVEGALVAKDGPGSWCLRGRLCRLCSGTKLQA